MLYSLMGGQLRLMVLLGAAAAFILTFVLLRTCQGLLPRDGGRKYAVNANLAKGKPRGAGVIFVPVFALCGLLFMPWSPEYLIYLLLTVGAMLSGYLDDASETPWGEYKKGLIDLILALAGAFTYLNFNGSSIALPFTGQTVTLPAWLFILLAVVLIWVSINVTNCSDGVDGLSGSLTLVTLGAFLLLCKGTDSTFAALTGIFMAALLAYQWYNASPSLLMMGDAGSRAMGFFIALAAMKSGNPFIYLLLALVLILDGGLSIAKISLKRFLKISILKNVRTPLHDHFRKNKGWSDTQVVFRFAILQLVICFVVLCLSL